jgi:hypothetical protein
MNKSQWQTKPDFNYRHILYETKRSNSKDIFNPMNYDKYEPYNIFMLLRHPVDRLISEYYFIKDRNEFLSLIKPIPRNLKDYIKSKQTNNYMIGFLLGKRMYDEELVDRDDLEQVINTIDSLKINIGVFEHYAKSLLHFSSITGIKWPKHIDVKRITLNRPKIDSIPEDIVALIEKHNSLDLELYNYCLKKFQDDSRLVHDDSKIKFKGNKYDYVLKYTERFNLLEIGLQSKTFITRQAHFFNALNIHLHKTLRLKNGKDYVINWNNYFIASIAYTFPGTPLEKQLNSISSEEPLDKTKAICDALNSAKTNNSRLYAKPMTFKSELVTVTRSSRGFLSKLFK